ncbi:DegQ family serine endoprotease [Parvibaculum sp.]|uniref:DegQ family serine endoprotease n=1 Tax=Parvibaculum sp. TaxID=2024848 RepID=UPI00272F1761|nr:DegQ family serine endoprotease [Parvibaculum sp.]MDP1627015.1 DegQ family serine endoprotease [Parvibaculum sp.]MDP2149809.1 DegQ family serine endoprotease [Parvibaculum sp.]MDP3327253.1 DegQ family serine endoprotease [Parvibaculum sp.]
MASANGERQARHFIFGFRGTFFAALLISVLAPFSAVPAFARAAPESFADLAERLSPAVVNISTSQLLQPGDMTIPGVPPGSPLNDFFEEFLEQQQGARPQRVQSLGSGFVIDADGVVITNNHVIEGADKIEVTFTDGTTLPATVAGTDPKTDIAVLKVKSDRKLPFVELGDSNTARVGDWVIAIGNPFGLGGSVTAGIVSALNRDIHAGNYDDFIQTDAAINRGNSGGPLFDMSGRVVGVNSAIISPSGASVGIGFAVPTSTVKPVVAQILKYGETRRGWLGVRIQSVTPEIAESLGLGRGRGALVAGVNPGGPADEAGIEPGDIILAFDGKNISTMRDLPRVVAEAEIGATVDVQLFRNGDTLTRKVEVARLEDEEVAPTEIPGPAGSSPQTTVVLGLALADLNDDLRQRFGVPKETAGALITDVDPLSAAAEKGIRPGEIIVEVAQRPVSSAADVEKIVQSEEKAGRNSVLFRLSLAGEIRFVALRLGG